MPIKTDKKLVDAFLSRGVEHVYPSLPVVSKALRSGKKLRVYFGIDPTSEKLHIGHAIGLRKMKELQDLGHEVIILLGSFTAMIGDPTGKDAARKQLTQKEVLENAATYKRQAGKILSFTGRNAAKIMFNHKWLSKLTFEDVVELSSQFTVQQMSERDMFARRLEEGRPVYLHEFLYPLMQGYDSVAMEVDMEIGGNDQTFNMLAGRTLMSKMKEKEKFVLATRLLVNDEGKKMSKSEGGFIALTDAPEDMYGKIMAMSDSMIIPYFEIATDVSIDDIEGIKLQLKKGVNPRDVKARLAKTIVTMFHSERLAERAEAHFEKVFRSKELPEEMEEFKLTKKKDVVTVLAECGLASSKSEARRLIKQGAVKMDGVVVDAEDQEVKGVSGGIVLQRGKRHFIRIVL